MKKLFAQVTYTFNNFYDNLNEQGQIVFIVIICLIIILLFLLLITNIVQKLKLKNNVKEIKEEIKENIDKEEKDYSTIKIEENKNLENTTIENIADSIKEAIDTPKPISLTDFEEEQEKTAIISIDELYEKAKELEIIDDDKGSINYLEKYNVKSAIEEKKEEVKTEVKAFKVSQVISPIYGVKKEVFENED